jgi:hypothetical protein
MEILKPHKVYICDHCDDIFEIRKECYEHLLELHGDQYKVKK